MDQGQAIVLAAILGIGGAVIGGWFESRRAAGRVMEERSYQLMLQQRAWEREERLAKDERLRQERLRMIEGTRRIYMGILTRMAGLEGELLELADNEVDADLMGELVEQVTLLAGKRPIDQKRAMSLGVVARRVLAAQRQRALQDLQAFSSAELAERGLYPKDWAKLT